MAPVAYDPLPQAELEINVWQELEQKKLLGPNSRIWLQNFCFSPLGGLWGLATLACCIYGLVRPNEAISEIVGRKVVCMAAAMGGLAIASAMCATRAAESLLQSEAFQKLLARCEAGHQLPTSLSILSGNRRHDFDCRCNGDLVQRLLRELLVGTLLALALSPAFSSDPMYFIGWLLLFGWIVLYVPGRTSVRWLLLHLSRNLVEQLMKNIADGPAAWKHSGQFWEEMTKAHQEMDGMLENAWALAMWFVIPDISTTIIFGVIGLVACLSTVVTSHNILVAFAGLFLICFNLLKIGQQLMDMASITQMCMSTIAGTKSILSYAIAKSGPSPCSEAALKSAGYASRAEERADHSRFLTYLMVNRAGVEMFGVFIDMELITRFMGQATTGFLALLSYMLANLDITTEEVLSSLEDTGRYVSDSLADTGRYFSEMVHLK